jgi:hypothetical protein
LCPLRSYRGQCWCLTPVILATLEAGFRRIVVLSQPGGNSSQDSISKKNPSQKKRAGGVAQGVGPEFKLQYHKKKKSYRDKYKYAKNHCHVKREIPLSYRINRILYLL